MFCKNCGQQYVADEGIAEVKVMYADRSDENSEQTCHQFRFISFYAVCRRIHGNPAIHAHHVADEAVMCVKCGTQRGVGANYYASETISSHRISLCSPRSYGLTSGTEPQGPGR